MPLRVATLWWLVQSSWCYESPAAIPNKLQNFRDLKTKHNYFTLNEYIQWKKIAIKQEMEKSM
jgi:hypothetical protein